MWLVRIIENNKIEAYLRAGLVKLRLALPSRVRKGIRIGPRRISIKQGSASDPNLLSGYKYMLFFIFVSKFKLIHLIL